MGDITTALATAIGLIRHLNSDLIQIIALSFQVSLSALVLGCLVGLPLGSLIAVTRFPGRAALVALLNAAMGLPSVVVGLFVYLLLSRAGPLGALGLLFTPTAMVIAQAILITPIIVALTQQTIADLYREYEEQLRSLNTPRWSLVLTLLWDGRFSLVTAVLAGFGRAIAEVGAVIIVGSNINHYTRVMTTAIVMETGKDDLPLALALGMILITLTLAINLLATVLSDAAYRRYG